MQTVAFSGISFAYSMDDQALFVASNHCFMFIIHKSRSLGKFKFICNFVKKGEENHFLNLLELHYFKALHATVKNVLLLSHDCSFSLHLWHPG